MDLHQYFPAGDRKVETCVIGTGSFGRSYLAQARRVPRMSARVAIDVDAETAARVLRDVGIEARRVRICSTAAEARSAWAAGDHIAASDLAVVLDLPIEVVVEATGHPEAAVRHAVLAIESGRHVVMVSKEADVVVGPGLAARAAEKGLVVTPVDGDQPSLLIGLVSWAEVLGFDIIAAGKSSECDFVFDAASGRLEHNGVVIEAPQFRSLWTLGTGNVAELVAARAKAAAALPQRVVADRCELAIVANSTGLGADRPLLHAPIARSVEIADVLALQGNGGLLSGPRKIDVFNALRAPNEAELCRRRVRADLLQRRSLELGPAGRQGSRRQPRRLHRHGLSAAPLAGPGGRNQRARRRAQSPLDRGQGAEAAPRPDRPRHQSRCPQARC